VYRRLCGKHSYDLSDEVVCELWIENPYYQIFLRRGVLSAPAAARSLVDDQLAQPRGRRTGCGRCLQESLAFATRAGAMKPSDPLASVQSKNVTFPTDAKLMNRAREKLVKLRQSWKRIGKMALITLLGKHDGLLMFATRRLLPDTHRDSGHRWSAASGQQENPLGAVAGALLIGVVIGMMGRARN
jgi:hypothetical protein